MYLRNQIKINKKILSRCLSKYNTGELISFSKSKLGLMNNIYFIKTTKGCFVLKIVRQNNSGNKISFEIDLLNYLKNLPTPKILRLKNKSYIFRLDKNKAFIMNCLGGIHKKTFNDRDLISISNFLGNFHNQSKWFKSNILRFKTLDDNQTKLRKIINKCNNIKDKKILDALLYIKKNIYNYLPPKNIAVGAIHSDLKPENCLFKDNKLVGVVDFDNSYMAPLVIDLANTIMWFCTYNGNLDKKKAKLIIDNYAKIRKISIIERKYIQKAIHFVYLRNLLRGIEYLQKGTINKNVVYWFIDNFLLVENKLPF